MKKSEVNIKIFRIIEQKWLLCILLVSCIVILNLVLLREYFGYGMVTIDWTYLIPFKRAVGSLFQKIVEIWISVGPRGSYYSIYLGILDSISPHNYEMIIRISVLWKILAGVSLFPAIWVLTRDKTIAFLSAVFFAISYSASGFLVQTSMSVEYIGIVFINLLTIAYFYFLKTNKLKYFILSFFCLYIALSIAYLRVFPIIFIVAGIEILRVWKKRITLFQGIIHIMIFVVPAFLMDYITNPVETMNRISIYDSTIKPLLSGNLFLLTTPLSGIGLQLVGPGLEHLLQNGHLITTGSYPRFVFPRVILLIIFVTLVIAKLISKEVKKFVVLTLILESIFLLILYVVMRFHFHLLPQDILPRDLGSWESVYFGAIVGSLVLSTSFVSGLEWFRSGKKNLTLFLVFISPLFTLFIITYSWILLAKHFTFDERVHKYLSVSALGISVFLASLVSAGIKGSRSALLSKRLVPLISAVFIVVYVFLTSQRVLDNFFIHYKSLGINTDQIKAQDSFYDKYVKGKNYMFVYFEPRSQNPLDTYWQGVLMPDYFGDWAILRKYYSSDPNDRKSWCYSPSPGSFEELKKEVVFSNQDIKFESIARCGKDAMRAPINPIDDVQKWVFSKDEFFAFTIKNGEIIDITQEVLNKLRADLLSNTK